MAANNEVFGPYGPYYQQNPGEQLARIDERTKIIQSNVTDLHQKVDSNKEILERKIDGQIDHNDKTFVKKPEFDPVKKIVYGLVGFVLLAFAGMFLTVIVKAGLAPIPTTPDIHQQMPIQQK